MKLLDEIKQIKSDRKTLKEFGLTMGIVLGLISAFLWWKQRHWMLMGGFSIFFFSFGFFLPNALLGIQKVWMSIALIMGFVMSRVILTIVFIVAVTPIGIISRLMGAKHLELAFRTQQASYWNQKPENTFDKKHYEHQF